MTQIQLYTELCMAVAELVINKIAQMQSGWALTTHRTTYQFAVFSLCKGNYVFFLSNS